MDEVAGEMKAEPYRLLRSKREEAARSLAQETRRKRIEEIRNLHGQGLSKSAIARQRQVSPTFVRCSISLDALPERRYRKRQASLLDPFEDYLLGRWQDGCRNAKQLWREVCALGYPGGYKRVHQSRQRQRLIDQAQVAPNSAGLPGRLKQGFAPQQLVWLLLLEVVYPWWRQLKRYDEAYHELGIAGTLTPLPRRWVVERTFAWLGKQRRFSKEYERLPKTSEALDYLCMSSLMLKRLGRAGAAC